MNKEEIVERLKKEYWDWDGTMAELLAVSVTLKNVNPKMAKEIYLEMTNWARDDYEVIES